MVESCSANCLSLKYLRSSAVRMDDKSLFYSIRFEFGFNDILTATAANILFQVRLSVIVIPDLIREPEWKHPLMATLRHTTVLNQVQDDESSSGWRIKFRMTTDQVRDDKYREPHLKEDVSIIHCSLFIVHYALWNEVRRKPIVHYALWNEVRRKPIMNC